MSKKARTVSNKAGKLMKCDGQMLKKVIEAKGYKLYELSKMLRYCSDYLTTCCRKNQISDVAAKYLMDYKIFPQMYDLEGEIKVGEPEEVKIDKDNHNEAARDRLKKRIDMINRNSTYGIPKDIAFYTDYGVVRSEKDLRNCIKQAIDHKGHQCLATNLITVRNILEKACAEGLSYDIKDMRNDLLVYAINVNTYPEKWVEFVNHLRLKYEPNRSLNAQEIRDRTNEAKEILNSRYGARSTYSGDCYINASRQIAAGMYHLMHAAMKDLKNDPEFKEMIKQAVKEAYEEL